MMFDTKILARNHAEPAFSVTYYLYEEKGDLVTFPKNPEQINKVQKYEYVCFAGLPAYIKEHKANRIAYKPRITKLTKEETIEWINIAKYGKLLPEYITEECLDNYFVFNLEPKNINLLYIYLTTVRDMDEHVDLIKSVIYLIKQFGMDVHSAIIFAANCTISNFGHFYFNFYGENKDINVTKLGLNYIVGLKKFLDSPSDYLDGNNAFTCSSVLPKINDSISRVSAKDIFDPNIIAVLSSIDNKKVFDKYLEKFKENKEKKKNK